MKTVVGMLNKYKDAILLGELSHNLLYQHLFKAKRNQRIVENLKKINNTQILIFLTRDAGAKPAGLHNSLLDPSNPGSDLWSAFNFFLLL